MVDEFNIKFTCDECETEFPDKAMLVKHMESIHMGDEANSKNQNNEHMRLPRCVSKIDPKYHSLVGKNIYRYSVKPDGTCQNTSKAAILFADPRRGTNISHEENKYLLQHFEQFELSYEWPHSILIGGGKKKTFKRRRIKKIPCK